MRPFRSAHGLRDSLAGIELAAMSIPQALGYASIAGMPAVSGLYTLFLPLLAFAAFGSSRYLVVAADSATAAILAGGVSGMAPVASPRYVALAGMVALLTAALLLLARLLRLGFLADFLSRTVLVGFLTGVGFQVGIAVLGSMLGLEVHSHRTVGQLAEIAGSLSRVELPSLGLSAVVVAGVLALDRLAPRVPGPLIAVAGAIAASAIFDFAGHGIGIIGPVTGGLPHAGLPGVSWKDIEPLIPVAGSCVVMIVAQSAATARIYALRHHQRPDDNADLAGLAAANAAAALSGTFVVNGSPTQTAMAERSGGQSQVTHVAAAAAVSLVLLFLTGPFQYLPRCVLGAIVFLVAIRLTDLRGLRAIRQESPGEYILALTTAAVVVLVGVEQGIVLAMVLSLLRVVRHSYRPHTAVLVRGQTGIWQLTPAVRGAVTEPGVAVYRFSAVLFYANAGMFSDEIRGLAGPAPSPLRWLVVDAGAITNVDYTAAQVVRELQQDLARRGVELVFAHVQSDLKPDLDRHRLTEAIGPSRIFDSLHEALAAYHALDSKPRL
ncbi:MAG: SulP family inorganic anion transporter [Bryobacteraceae bacterium]|jgi:high affinity sulfate transporter 1